jgi:hypothetical protein
MFELKYHPILQLQAPFACKVKDPVVLQLPHVKLSEQLMQPTEANIQELHIFVIGL